MIGLPKPRLTATISPPGPRKHDLGAVVVHGYTPPPREDDPAEPPHARPHGRAHRAHHCSACGGRHNSRNRLCPARGL